MALSSTGVWEVRSTGNDLNGGFFNPERDGTDYSQDNTPILSVGDVVTDGSVTVTSATGGFTEVMVGNGISIAGVVFEITQYTNSGAIKVDRNAAAATGQMAKVGGALASPGKLASVMAIGNQVWLRGTFSITSSTANVPEGVVNLVVGGTGSNSNFQGMSKWEGYATARGDAGHAVLQASGISSVSIFTFSPSSGAYSRLVNLTFDGNAQTSIRGASGGGAGNWTYVEKCLAKNCTNGGFWEFSEVFDSEVQNCSGASGIEQCSRIVKCTVHNHTSGEAAIHARSGAVLNCLIYNCNMVAVKTDAGGSVWNCRTFNCARGFETTGYPRDNIVYGCLAWGSTVRNYQNGFNQTVVECAGGGAPNADTNAVGLIPLTMDPYIDSGSEDFRLTPGDASYLIAAGMNLQTEWLGSFLIRRSIEL